LPQAVKFEFDREFSQGAVVAARSPAKKVKWTEREVEAIRASAYAQGEADAQASQEAQAARHIAACAQTIAEHVGAMQETLRAARRGINAEAAEIAVTIARKLMPALMELAPTAEIDAVVRHAFALLRDEPRVVVGVAPEDLETLEQQVDEMARAHGFDGALVLRAEEGIAAGDVRIEWAKGAITRDTPALDGRIEQIVRTYVSAPDADETEQTDFFALLGK